jgi:hypothetical protein
MSEIQLEYRSGIKFLTIEGNGPAKSDSSKDDHRVWE